MLKKELAPLFPFLGKKSLEIIKRLQSSIVLTLPYCKLKVIFKYPSKIVNHFHLKDMLPKKPASALSGITYKCNSCNAIFYGKTKRQL